MSPAFTSRLPCSDVISTTSASGAAHGQSVQRHVLTDRQESIVAMIARGLTCQDVSHALRLPLRTVEGHVDLILEALGLTHLEDLDGHATGSGTRPAPGRSRSSKSGETESENRG